MKNFTVSKISSVIQYAAEESSWISQKRPHHILAYQLSGFYFHYFEKTSLLVKPDTFFFINQKDDYRVERTVCGGSALCIHFLTDEDIDLPSFGISGLKNPQIKKDFYKIFNAWNDDTEENYFLAYSLLYKLLNELKFFTEKPYIPLKTKRSAEKIALVLENRYQEKIDFEDLANSVGFSTRYVNKIFRAQYGVTPNQYLINYRILKALELLTTTKSKIEEIALKTGFSDPYYFSKFFKKQTGYSPAKFRKQYS